MATLRWGLQSSQVNRLLTLDSVPLEKVVADVLWKIIDRYNDYGNAVDWRARFCEDADEQLIEFDLLDQTRLEKLGAHSSPKYMANNKGIYQEFTNRWGVALGYDIEFLKYGKLEDYVKKMELALKRDVDTIRYEILKEITNPQSYGAGFYNQTFDALGMITAPPSFANNTFTAAHTHYLTTGAATLANLNAFTAAKQHIREHGRVNGDYLCLLNSANLTEIENLAAWVGTNRANISNSFTDGPFAKGIENEFNYLGMDWVCEDWIPAGYFIVLGGTKSSKPIKFHQPNNSQFRGLMWYPGPNGTYPLIDSYVFHEFKPRVWQRWQGVVYQITANYTYTPPTQLA